MALSDQEQIRLLNIDASRIASKALAVNLNCIIGGGQLSVSAGLNESASSLNTKVKLTAEKIAAESLNKFLLLPENYFSGEIERIALVGTGVIDSPRYLERHDVIAGRRSACAGGEFRQGRY